MTKQETIKLSICCLAFIVGLYCYQWIIKTEAEREIQLINAQKAINQPSSKIQQYRFFHECPKNSQAKSVEYIAEHALDVEAICNGGR